MLISAYYVYYEDEEPSFVESCRDSGWGRASSSRASRRTLTNDVA